MTLIPELLAPAGNYQSLIAAVENGADAVYLGGKDFSARQHANNFNRSELVRALHYAHSRGVRIYVAVNTLVGDEEMEKALRYLHFLAEEGADAVIIQDLGLLALVQDLLPKLKIHASTQMTVYDKEGLDFLYSRGVRRVVLARELSLEEIKTINRGARVETEVFVHGALCVSYSGQCLMSSMVGGRSGNRGLCTQPCRLPYMLMRDNGRPILQPGPYLLSTRDLKLIEYIPELASAGVKALKIEGRMKSPEYVAVVTRAYHKALRLYEKDPKNYRVDPMDNEKLAQIFNRGFTPGFAVGILGKDLMSYKRPSNRGVFLGRITELSGGKRGKILLQRCLAEGDKLEVWVTRGGRIEFRAKNLKDNGRETEKVLPRHTVELNLPENVKEGDRVFKVENRELIEQARLSFEGEKKGRIPLCSLVEVSPGEPLVLKLTDAEGYSSQAKTAFIAESAYKKPLDKEVLWKQLERLGETPFFLCKLDIHMKGNPIVPFSEINKVRRAAVNKLLEARRKKIRKTYLTEEKFVQVFAEKENALNAKRLGFDLGRRTPLLSVYAGSYPAVKAALEGGADRVYIRYGYGGLKEEELKRALKLCFEVEKEVVIGFPLFQHPEDLAQLQKILEKDKVFEGCGFLVSNWGMLKTFSRITEKGFSLFADYQLNSFNAFAIDTLLKDNVTGITLSRELSRTQVAGLCSKFPGKLEYLVHGNFPLMVSKHCVPGAVVGGRSGFQNCSRPCRENRFVLKDRKGFCFPLYMDENCRMYVFNSRELCLIEEIPSLIKSGVHSLRIEAYKEDKDYIGFVTCLYRDALDKYKSDKGREMGKYLKEKADKLAHFSPYGITKGHYLRGVTSQV